MRDGILRSLTSKKGTTVKKEHIKSTHLLQSKFV